MWSTGLGDSDFRVAQRASWDEGNIPYIFSGDDYMSYIIYIWYTRGNIT